MGTIRNVARCWTYETSVALDQEIPNELPYNDYFEYFGPDFKLHIAPSNMANQNTSEYVDKIRSRLLENLRMLPHAPGVQMSDIPEDSIDLNKEDEKDDEDKDKRNPMKLMDKRIEPDNELKLESLGTKTTTAMATMGRLMVLSLWILNGM